MGLNLIGQTLGKYRILEEIGRGGMAVVYKAYQPALERYVAIKVLPQQFTFDREFVQRFLREARAAARLNHPHIVTIHDVSQADGTYYIVMEYLEGPSLADLLRQQGALPPQQVAQIVSQVASALDYAHGQGFVHRDVKPSNVLLGVGGVTKLTDFGIVKAAEGTQLTQTGTLLGTPEYMSPEQARGGSVSYPSDVYSLGVVAYEMLTGRVLFSGDTLAVLHAHAYEPPDLRPLPQGVRGVIGRALAKEPRQRYGSTGTFAQALERAMAGMPVEGWAVEPPTRVIARPRVVQPRARRLPGWVWGLGGLATLMLVVGIATMLGDGPVPLPVSETPTDVVPPGKTRTATVETVRRFTETPAPPPAPEDTPTLTPTEVPPLDTPTSTPKPAATYTPSPPPTPTPTPTPESPHPAGIAGRIAFTRNPYGHQDSTQEIYLLELSTGSVRRLTNNSVADWDPGWSPDGEWIAFVSFQLDNYDIWVMRSDSSGQAARITLPAWDDYPAWSPDGSQIAIASTGVTEGVANSEIFVGSGTGSMRQVTFNTGRDEWPSWAPDGQWLACSSDRDGDMDIYLFTTDGGNIVHWTDDSAYDEQPAWSPDGQWIAFTRKTQDTDGDRVLERRDDGDFGNLWIGRKDGSEFRQLTYDNRAADPAWSPDGRYIVFTHARDTTGDGYVGLDDASDLWVVPATGGDPIVLLEGPEQDWAPDWTR